MQPDSPLERIRKARCQISEECGHDPKRLVEYYVKLQERHHDRLVRSTDHPPAPTPRTASEPPTPTTPDAR
jgi:hypothetical protein